VALKIIGDYRAVFELHAEGRFYELYRHFEPRLRERDELFGRWPAVPFVPHLGERVDDAGTHADQGGFLDAEFGYDLIGGAEADGADVVGQPVRVLRDELNGVGAIVCKPKVGGSNPSPGTKHSKALRAY